jgi:hypothetical protein
MRIICVYYSQNAFTSISLEPKIPRLPKWIVDSRILNFSGFSHHKFLHWSVVFRRFWALETHFSWKSRFHMSSIRIWTKRRQSGTTPPLTCSDGNITPSNRRWLVHWLYLYLNFTQTTCFERRINHLRLESYERWTEPRFPSSYRRKGTSCLGRSRLSCY